MRRVISLWLPRFTTDRLCRRRPEWRTAPLAIVSECRAARTGLARDGGLAVRIVAANRAAEQAAGIVPGMTLSDARARLPDLRTARAEPEADRRALAGLAEWCTRWTPWAALDAPDLAPPPAAHHAIWLDVTGVAHLFGGEAALLEDLCIRLTHFGFAASAALADTPGAAWAVSHFATRKTRRVVRKGGARAALAALPVAALRLDPAAVEGLERLGLRRIDALAALPRAALARRFGARVLERLDQALGRAPEPLSPALPAEPLRVRLAYAEPIGHLEAVAVGLRRLLASMEARLVETGLGARRLVLSLYRVDGKCVQVMVETCAPARAPRHLMALFEDRLDGLALGFGVDLMTLDAPVTAPLAAAQPVLDGLAGPGRPRGRAGDALGLLIDRLDNRYGRRNVHRLVPHASHWPERAQRRAAPLCHETASRRETADSGAWSAHRHRPLRLLARPEAVEAVAMLPDEPPMMFRWRRVMHRIVKADGPERLAAEWWRGENAGAEDALRDYYRVEDADGRRFWLYRDAPYDAGRSPTWWLHGLFA